MPAWIVDVYENEKDKDPSHRAVAKGTTEQEALKKASKIYKDSKVVVSVGRTAYPLPPKKDVHELWSK